MPTFSLADVFGYLAYPLFLSALIQYPFENRYEPSRFRFLLDVAISAGVVATMVWLMLGQVGFGVKAGGPGAIGLSDRRPDPLMILVNMLLANRKARRTLFLWGCGLFSFLISDYIYSLLAPVNGYQAGGAESLGWTAGGAHFWVGAVFMSSGDRMIKVSRSCRRSTWAHASRTSCLLPLSRSWAGLSWPTGASVGIFPGLEFGRACSWPWRW